MIKYEWYTNAKYMCLVPSTFIVRCIWKTWCTLAFSSCSCKPSVFEITVMYVTYRMLAMEFLKKCAISAFRKMTFLIHKSEQTQLLQRNHTHRLRWSTISAYNHSWVCLSLFLPSLSDPGILHCPSSWHHPRPALLYKQKHTENNYNGTELDIITVLEKYSVRLYLWWFTCCTQAAPVRKCACWNTPAASRLHS